MLPNNITQLMILEEIMNDNAPDILQDEKINLVLKEYSVNTEEEFQKVLNSDWNLLICHTCQNKIDILHCKYEDGTWAICNRCGSRV